MGLQDAPFFSSGSSRLNFDPDEFLSPSFSVDSFIQRKRVSVPLDVLRDDLGAHLKTLRSSLIELINQDYGQFVSLSSNLVGLDGKIQSISGPLVRARNDLQGFDTLLTTNIEGLSEQLERKRRVREGKAQIQYLRMAAASLQLAEKVVAKLPQEIGTEADLNLLKDCCDEVGEGMFLLQSCTKSEYQEDLLKKWNRVFDSVLGRIKSLLKQHAGKKEVEADATVLSLLRMCTELQCESTVEKILVSDVLAPKCDAVLLKKGNFGAVLDEVEKFIGTSSILRVWKMVEENPWLEEYDFIGRGVFPSVYNLLSKHYPHIWSPANPDTFHSNWRRCEKLVESLENAIPTVEHLRRFRDSEELKDFYSKWQFPVYFQLRFHAIASELEEALQDVSSPCANAEFKLDSTRVLIRVLNRCWDKDTVYISRASGRFLKASALLVSRYINEVEKKIAKNSSASSVLCIHAYCDLNYAELVVRQFLLEKLLKELNIGAEENGFTLETNGELDPSATQFLSGFLWNEVKGAVESNLVEMVVSQCSTSISSVNEVPRLYRKTNRDAPTKQLEYVESILSPISSLKVDIHNAHQSDLWDNVNQKIGSQIVQRYYAQVKEVLVAVQLMEESLRRLKKVKGQNAVSDSSSGLTDDDKIRLQLQLDVDFFVQKVGEISQAIDTSQLQSLFQSVNGKS